MLLINQQEKWQLKKEEQLIKIGQILLKLPINPEMGTVAGRYVQLLAHYFCHLEGDAKNWTRKRIF